MALTYLMNEWRFGMYTLSFTGALCAAVCVASSFVMPTSLAAEEPNEWIADARSAAYARSVTAETSGVANPLSYPASYDENTSSLVPTGMHVGHIDDVVSTGSISQPSVMQSAPQSYGGEGETLQAGQ